mgnify:FL=1
MIYDAFYTVHLSPEEGPTQIRVHVDKDTGIVKVAIFNDREDGQKQKNTFTFDNDGDVKALTDTLKWARIKSLRARGYKVVE